MDFLNSYRLCIFSSHFNFNIKTRRKFTITKLTVVEFKIRSENQALSLSTYLRIIFQQMHSAQFNLSSSILTTPSGQRSNATVVAAPSSHHPPYRQDRSVKDHFDAEDKKSTVELTVSSSVRGQLGVSCVPSVGAAGGTYSKSVSGQHLLTVNFDLFSPCPATPLFTTIRGLIFFSKKNQWRTGGALLSGSFGSSGRRIDSTIL